MRRKSTRNAQKATPDKPAKETETPPKTRRSRRRKRSPSKSSDSEEEVIVVTKHEAPAQTPDTTTKSHTPTDEETSEEPMWKVTSTEDSPTKGEIQKLKLCLTRPAPDSPEKTKSRRSKSESQTEDDATSSEDKSSRRTRSHGSPFVRNDGLSSQEGDEDGEEKKGKGKSKGKHKSKIEKPPHLSDPELQTNNEISENAQVTPQSPSIDKPVDNESDHKVDVDDKQKVKSDQGRENIEESTSNVAHESERNLDKSFSTETKVTPQDDLQEKESDDEPLSVIQKNTTELKTANEPEEELVTTESALKDQQDNETLTKDTSRQPQDDNIVQSEDIRVEEKVTLVPEQQELVKETALPIESDIKENEIKEETTPQDSMEVAPQQEATEEKIESVENPELVSTLEEKLSPPVAEEKQQSPPVSEEKQQTNPVDEKTRQPSSEEEQKQLSRSVNEEELQSSHADEKKQSSHADEKKQKSSPTDEKKQKSSYKDEKKQRSRSTTEEKQQSSHKDEKKQQSRPESEEKQQASHADEKKQQSRRVREEKRQSRKEPAEPRLKLKRNYEPPKPDKENEEPSDEPCHIKPSKIQRKWKIESTVTPLVKIDLESIQALWPTIDFPEEPDLKLEVEKERRKSTTESSGKMLERKVSVEYKSDFAERPQYEKQTSLGSSKDGEDNSNIIAFNRKISIVDDTASKLKPPPSPAKNPISNILYITNLVRPFTVKQLKELLERTGKIREDGFWTDRIKSKCYVQYETQEESEATRNALHGVQWPIGNGKKLVIDYATEEEMLTARNPPAPPPAPAPVPEAKPIAKENVEPIENKIRNEEKSSKELEKKKTEPVREWDIGKKDVRRNRSRSRERSRKHRRSPSPSDDFISRKQRKAEESVPQKLMDDLFLKTKATPSIYWQPLSPEEISMKQQQRLIRMEEHKRRMEENSRMKGREMGRGAFRRRYD